MGLRPCGTARCFGLPTCNVALRVSSLRTRQLFQLFLRKIGTRTFFCTRFVRLAFALKNLSTLDQVTTKVFPTPQCFINFVHMGSKLWFFLAIVMSSTYTDRKRPCSVSPIHFPEELLFMEKNGLLIAIRQRVSAQVPFEATHKVLQYCALTRAILCRGRRVHMSGHLELGSFNKAGASSISTWV